MDLGVCCCHLGRGFCRNFHHGAVSVDYDGSLMNRRDLSKEFAMRQMVVGMTHRKSYPAGRWHLVDCLELAKWRSEAVVVWQLRRTIFLMIL